MADLERGERIKQLRLERHMTQPAVADMVGVTLRAYQEWEAGGGIQWENVKRLSGLLRVDPEYVMRGQKPDTPDPLAPDQIVQRLDRIERLVIELIERLVAAEVIRAVEQELEKAPPPVRSKRRTRAA